MNQKKFLVYLTVFCTGSLISPCEVLGQGDTAGQRFFTDVEKNLRADYVLCTGDSSTLPLVKLIEWRRTLDSIIECAEYPVIVRKFTEETGIAAVDARPCEIVKWMKRVERERLETATFLENERKNILQRRSDSLYLLHELVGVRRAVYDLASIPFGLSRRSVVILARRNGLTPTTGSVEMPIVCDSVPIGMMSFKAAFHFTKEDRYWCYELESATCSIDSLDKWARPLMDYLAAHMENITSQPPDHIYRVGMLDIVPGRLNICKLWNLESAFIYVGLARMNNRFYAKAIVQSK